MLVGGAFQHRAVDPRTTQLAELLAGQFTVYHYDRRGRGDSGDTTPYAVGREIDDLAALIEDAGGSASVFGMSSGAVLALRVAAHGNPMTLREGKHLFREGNDKRDLRLSDTKTTRTGVALLTDHPRARSRTGCDSGGC